MPEFFHIIYEVVAPIFLLIGVGYAIQKKIGFEGRTLVRLNFWVFTPAFIFAQITGSKLSAVQMLLITGHFALLFGIMGALTWGLARCIGAQERLQRALVNSVLFYNSGNYGVPVAKLAFGGAGLDVQTVAIMLQNATNFTVGLWMVAGGRGRSRRDVLRDVLRLPMVYTLVAAWAWRVSGLPLPLPVQTALEQLKNGLVPVALITLGAQMAMLKVPRLSRPLALSLGLRLVVGPAIGFALVMVLQAWGAALQGDLARALVISTCFPTAVNSALVAIEYHNEPEFASAAVFYSTLFSAVTVSLAIYLVRHTLLLR